MKKKIGIWLTVFLLLLQSAAAPVYAEPENNSVVEAVSGYCMGDELYAFFRMDEGYDVGSLKVDLQSTEVSASGEGAVVPITESSSIVHYVFMVDKTGSMRGYIEEINAFVDALTAEEKQEAFYTVATFGECFEVVSENLTDQKAVKRVLEELDYTEQLTDPYTGMESALTYLDGYSRRSGDLVNLILITDGEPDLGIKDADEAAETEKQLAQAAAEKIVNAPEVIVSTLCTAEWEEKAYETFSQGRGIHEHLDDNQDAAAAGKKMAQYVDSLYLTNIKLSKAPSSDRFSMELQIQGNNLEGQLALLRAALEGVPNLKLFSDSETPETLPDKKIIEGDKGDETESGDKKPENPEPLETQQGTETENESEEGTEAGNESQEGEKVRTGIPVLYIVIPVVCVLLIVGTVIVVLNKKRSSRGAGSTAGAKTESSSGGIAMKLEVYSGNCISRGITLYLTDTLTIGSSPQCNLRFDNPDVDPIHSRIVLKDQIIYIEDLNSKEGTFLGGMRIQGQNRLRSGDVISIGEVEFCLRF